uniref:Uncharacterized protein n=1 Tax=Periophthalmus magnuspinnatus TaxID=409849 RepID=A0A3B4AH00_9GOBI
CTCLWLLSALLGLLFPSWPSSDNANDPQRDCGCRLTPGLAWVCAGEMIRPEHAAVGWGGVSGVWVWGARKHTKGVEGEQRRRDVAPGCLHVLPVSL